MTNAEIADELRREAVRVGGPHYLNLSREAYRRVDFHLPLYGAFSEIERGMFFLFVAESLDA